MQDEELTIEKALQIIADGTPRLKRFHDHYLTNAGVVRHIISVACTRGYFQPRRTVRDLIKAISDAVNNENDVVISDCAASLDMLYDLLCEDEQGNGGVAPFIIPPEHMPAEELIDALLFNFCYRAFLDEHRPPAAS